MDTIHIRQGRNIKIKGAASKEIAAAPLPSKVGVYPSDFRGMHWRPVVKEGDAVKVGAPLLEDKAHPQIKIVSPASGRVSAVNRGEKRVLLSIVVDTDGRQEAAVHAKYSPDQLRSLSRDNVIQQLLVSGVWACIRQRPFSRIASLSDTPKSIFVRAMSTDPLALDVDFVLQGREQEFQAGLDILCKLTKGDVHVCCDAKASSRALTQARNVKIHGFSGPHPAGNISTHIHYVDPVRKGDIVWYLGAEDVLRIAALFTRGVFSPERIVAVAGEGVDRRVYLKTVIGAPVSSLVGGRVKESLRYISGSVLSGASVGPNGFLGFYDTQLTVIPEGGKRRFLGWITPGFGSYSFSKTFASSFLPDREVALDTDTNGSERAVVLNEVYDAYVPLDIMTFFLMRAVIAGDIEEAENLGILECDEEDFALCTFACPSKVDVGGIIRGGLDLIEKEG
ncbi:MAG: Na(+)-translocating NADH-quinone reductase subunit A [Candidatus Omnitrophota bacterium]|nr:Na(+)-translocating NADH-quinone reductase subunit A [Candidatus Omnitrophota bacterium]MDZ4241435.1 Na(+)-translocating NADH-quinone reductase subunit A [Candidatus Omnitrophota bacterium]